MNLREVLAEGWYGIAIFAGVICGLGAVYNEVAPVFVLVGLIVAGIGIYAPTLPIGLVFAGILADVTGALGLSILGLPVTISKLAVLLSLGCYLLNAIMRGKPLFRFSWLVFSLAVVIMSMIASVATSGMPSAAFQYIMGVSMLTIMVTLIDSAVEEQDMADLIKFMGVVIILSGFWNLVNRQSAVVFRLDQAWQERSSGTFEDPNFWALFLVVSCPLMIAGLAEEDSWSSRTVLAGVLLFYPVLVIGSYSRAGMIGMLVTAPGVLYLVRKQWRYVVLVGLIAVPLLPLTVNLDAAIMRYGTLFNPAYEAELGHASLSERTMLLYAGLELIRQNPISGIGVGMFPTYASYVTAGGVWKVAHNTYITVWVEQGLLGVFSHLFVAANVVYVGYRGYWYSPSPYFQAISVGFLVGISGTAVMAMTLNVMEFSPIYYCMGLALVAESTTRTAPESVAIRTAIQAV